MELSNKIASDITIFSKYAKHNKELLRRENWDEICDRKQECLIKKYPELEDKIIKAVKFERQKKVLGSMRMAQFAGVPVERNNSRVYNCAYHSAKDIDFFSNTMFLLLGGSGVGFSVQHRHIDQLPSIQKPTVKNNKVSTRKFLIGDSIEGWADAIKVLMNHYLKGSYRPRFDYSDIRAKGVALVTAGGKAPGPEPLRTCISKIMGLLDNKKIGSRLESWEVSDIVCYTADAVYSGGIRRAALICGFDANDEDMLGYKAGSFWDLHPERARVNVSAVSLRKGVDKKAFSRQWSFTENSGTGEPGIYWTNDLDMFTNPCCFTGDMRLATDKDFVSFRELEKSGGECVLLGKDSKPYPGLVWKVGERRVINIKLSTGKTIACTLDHEFMLNDGSTCMAKNLKDKRLMPLYSIRTEVSEAPKVIALTKEPFLQTVYDFSIENDDHWGVVEGVIAHNCEIALKDKQFCNLTTINFSTVTSQTDLESRAKTAAFLGTLQAGFTDFHYLGEDWVHNCEEEALIGVSVTGIADGNNYKNYDWKRVADLVVKRNIETAKLININPAARTTCIKPEGTTSLVLGTASGIHGRHAHYYIRRIRLEKSEPIAQYLMKNHIDIVKQDKTKPTGIIVELPQKSPDRSIYRTEDVMNLLERVKYFSENWINPGHVKGDNKHNVSCTISIKDNEWNKVGEWMWNNREYYNGIAVLPYDGGKYVQPPFEDCTKETYERMMKSLTKVDLSKVIEKDDETVIGDTIACSGGKCEI